MTTDTLSFILGKFKHYKRVEQDSFEKGFEELKIQVKFLKDLKNLSFDNEKPLKIVFTFDDEKIYLLFDLEHWMEEKLRIKRSDTDLFRDWFRPKRCDPYIYPHYPTWDVTYTDNTSGWTTDRTSPLRLTY